MSAPVKYAISFLENTSQVELLYRNIYEKISVHVCLYTLEFFWLHSSVFGVWDECTS